MVGLAVIAVPNIPAMFRGLVPVIPRGGLFYTLALAGGVGGTITLAAYGYWLREKGWSTPRWMRIMRIDNAMAYVPFRFYLFWLTFPPMVLLQVERPIGLILVYGVLGSLFMPFLAITLLGLLNGRHAPPGWANGPIANLLPGVTTLLFAALGARQLWSTLPGLF